MIAERSGEFSRQVSLMLVKPEYHLLPEEERLAVDEKISENVGGSILQTIELRLDREQAENFWGNIKDHPWAPDYYDFMASQTVRVHILEGNDKASQAKRELREYFAETIERLSQEVGLGFSADIFHGSEPDESSMEMDILHITI